jgi:hypothetical protein
MARRSFRPCPLNPPLTADQRAQIEAKMIGFYAPFKPVGRYLKYEDQHAFCAKRMKVMDALPKPIRESIHVVGFAKGLAKVLPKTLKRGYSRHLKFLGC